MLEKRFLTKYEKKPRIIRKMYNSLGNLEPLSNSVISFEKRFLIFDFVDVDAVFASCSHFSIIPGKLCSNRHMVFVNKKIATHLFH